MRARRLAGAFLASIRINLMQLPSFLQGDSLTRLAQGIAIGAIGTMIVGFYWGGWTLGSTAKEQAQRSAASAVVAALAPICVDKFQLASDSTTNLVELKKVTSWQQATFVEKGGWATLPGSKTPDTAVARACAELLISFK
jgi:hypothetical protein